MSKTIRITAVAVALALTSYSANGQQRATESLPLLPKFYSAEGFGVIPPESKSPCSGTPGTAVIFDLGDLLTSLKNNGKITRTIERKGGGAQKYVKILENVGPKYWPTNLDMQLAELKDVTKPDGGYIENQYVMVTVVLPKTSKNVEFLRPKDSVDPQDSTYAVTVEPGKIDRFCGRTPIESYKGDARRNSVTFGVLSGKNEPRSINIGIMIPNTTNGKNYWLPIIIDPIVENEG